MGLDWMQLGRRDGNIDTLCLVEAMVNREAVLEVRYAKTPGTGEQVRQGALVGRLVRDGDGTRWECLTCPKPPPKPTAEDFMPSSVPMPMAQPPRLSPKEVEAGGSKPSQQVLEAPSTDWLKAPCMCKTCREQRGE